jgi:plasmid stabilization system protein ParE
LKSFIVIDEEVQAEPHFVSRTLERFDEHRAVKFQRSLKLALHPILEHPLSRPVVGVHPERSQLQLRRVLVSDFPYALLYHVFEPEGLIRVLACYHARSDPEAWFRTEPS